jgi:hypothetical protein
MKSMVFCENLVGTLLEGQENHKIPQDSKSVSQDFYPEAPGYVADC